MFDFDGYGLLLERDDNGTFLVTCPDLPEVTTFGEDEDDAYLRGNDAIEEALAARIAQRQPLPIPDTLEGLRTKPLPLQTRLKISIYLLMLQRNISKAELARQLNQHAPQIDRLLDLNHASRIDQIEAAFGALGAYPKLDIFMFPDPETMLGRKSISADDNLLPTALRA